MFHSSLESSQCIALSDKITECLTKWNIYEYNPTGNKLIPVVNPSSEALADPFVLNPICNESKTWLSKLSNYLNITEKILIL